MDIEKVKGIVNEIEDAKKKKSEAEKTIREAELHLIQEIVEWENYYKGNSSLLKPNYNKIKKEILLHTR